MVREAQKLEAREAMEKMRWDAAPTVAEGKQAEGQEAEARAEEAKEAEVRGALIGLVPMPTAAIQAAAGRWRSGARLREASLSQYWLVAAAAAAVDGRSDVSSGGRVRASS